MRFITLGLKATGFVILLAMVGLVEMTLKAAVAVAMHRNRYIKAVRQRAVSKRMEEDRLRLREWAEEDILENKQQNDMYEIGKLLDESYPHRPGHRRACKFPDTCPACRPKPEPEPGLIYTKGIDTPLTQIERDEVVKSWRTRHEGANHGRCPLPGHDLLHGDFVELDDDHPLLRPNHEECKLENCSARAVPHLSHALGNLD